MSITGYTTARLGELIRVTATSDLTPPVWFFWYLDGSYLGRSASGSWSVQLDPGEQAQLIAVDSTDASYDPLASPPAGYPARRTLSWIRSLSADTARYRIEQQRESDGWQTLGELRHVPGHWEYTYLTPRLDDLTEYTWRITPVDRVGNEGDPVTIGPERIVRRPDAPQFTAAYDPITERVTFALA